MNTDDQVEVKAAVEVVQAEAVSDLGQAKQSKDSNMKQQVLFLTSIILMWEVYNST